MFSRRSAELSIAKAMKKTYTVTDQTNGNLSNCIVYDHSHQTLTFHDISGDQMFVLRINNPRDMYNRLPDSLTTEQLSALKSLTTKITNAWQGDTREECLNRLNEIDFTKLGGYHVSREYNNLVRDGKKFTTCREANPGWLGLLGAAADYVGASTSNSAAVVVAKKASSQRSSQSETSLSFSLKEPLLSWEERAKAEDLPRSPGVTR